MHKTHKINKLECIKIIMQIGDHKVPEIRLEILLKTVLNKIYNAVKMDQIQSRDLAKLLGYKYGTEPTLFKKINSMLTYGVLEGRGTYCITKLGEDLLFPESSEIKKQLKVQAIFNVELWKKLFLKNGKGLPKEGLWVQLKNITNIDPATAKKFENRVFGWYVDDIESIPDDYEGRQHDMDEWMESSTPNTTEYEQTSQEITQSKDRQIIYFDKYTITLPKGDLIKEWEKLKKYMEIKLEDYTYKPEEKTTNDEYHVRCPNCGKTADGKEFVETLFGMRNLNGKQVAQSWCITCRSQKHFS